MPSIRGSNHSRTRPERSRIFILDAFSNPEHLRYVLGGTLASMLCYVFYVSLDWRNLSTSLTTCVLTALTSIGSSRQKQVLRIAGFILGGVIAGLGAQIFILPEIDSIVGFTVLFAIMTAVAAWIATSSPRLSYAGVQIAFSFYLIHLSDFSFQTDLTVPRDRVLGVLLGVTMMWLVFERLFPRSAADEMVRIFVANVRLMAALVSCTARADDPASILKIRRQREEIYRHFGEVNAQSDAVPFETGPSAPGRDGRPRPNPPLANLPAEFLSARSSAPPISHLRQDRLQVALRSPHLRMTFALNVRASSSISQRALRSSRQPTHTTQTQ